MKVKVSIFWAVPKGSSWSSICTTIYDHFSLRGFNKHHQVGLVNGDEEPYRC